MNLVFLIRDLGYGGAQKQLVTLVQNLDRQYFNVTVLYFYAGGHLEAELQASGISCICLKKQGRWDTVPFVGRLLQHLRRLQPDVLHGYLDESNLLTIAIKPFFPHTKIVWGVRDSDMDLQEYDWLARLIFQLVCWLAPRIDRIIVNSHAGKHYYQTKGFPSTKMVVIPNGIDTEQFQANAALHQTMRIAWQIPENTWLIGQVGRLHPMKDYPTFLQAAALLYAKRQDVHFVCVGTGCNHYTQELQQLTDRLGLSAHVTWTGGQSGQTMPALYNALDILCSASAYGEGFSNVIGEAMACGIPCVVTDVGDSARLVGNQGIVIPPKNPEALSHALQQQLDTLTVQKFDRQALRNRIVNQFSVQQLAQNTQICLCEQSYA
jgi:glycosyltransferase involved in cell wall biosynthesis